MATSQETTAAHKPRTVTRMAWLRFFLANLMCFLILCLTFDIARSWMYEINDSSPYPVGVRLAILFASVLFFTVVVTWHLLVFNRRWRGIRYAVGVIFVLGLLPAVFYFGCAIVWGVMGERHAGWGIYLAVVMLFVAAPVALFSSLVAVGHSFLIRWVRVNGSWLARFATVSILLTIVYPVVYRPALSSNERSKIHQTKEFNQMTIAIENHPRDVELLWRRAYVQRRLGEFDGARDDYRRIVAIEPNHKAALTEIARGLSYLGELEEPIEIQTKLIRLAPDVAVYRERRADLYQKKKEYDLAIQDYSDAFRMENGERPTSLPDDKWADFLFQRARLHEANENYQGARKDYLRAQNVGSKRWKKHGSVKYHLEHLPQRPVKNSDPDPTRPESYVREDALG